MHTAPRPRPPRHSNPSLTTCAAAACCHKQPARGWNAATRQKLLTPASCLAPSACPVSPCSAGMGQSPGLRCREILGKRTVLTARKGLLSKPGTPARGGHKTMRHKILTPAPPSARQPSGQGSSACPVLPCSARMGQSPGLRCREILGKRTMMRARQGVLSNQAGLPVSETRQCGTNCSLLPLHQLASRPDKALVRGQNLPAA